MSQGNTDENRENDMSTVTQQGRGAGVATKLAGGVLALGVVATVAVSGNYLWQRNAGPTQASKTDCVLAQQLFDRAQTPPADPAKIEAWDQEIRKIRYTMDDLGLNTEVGHYARWAATKATGQGDKPTAEQVDKMLSRAKGHCRDSGVALVIPALKF